MPEEIGDCYLQQIPDFARSRHAGMPTAFAAEQRFRVQYLIECLYVSKESPRAVIPLGWLPSPAYERPAGLGSLLTGLRVVLADEQPVFRDGLACALEDRGADVVAAVANATDVVPAVVAHDPHVVLMDLSASGIDGLEVTRLIVADHPATAVLVLTISDDDDLVFAALRAGVRGYLLKKARADDIARAVATVANGEAVLGARISDRVLGVLANPTAPLTQPRPLPQLTDREREVLDLVARGYQNLRIARRLGLTEKTVRNHVSTILTKLPAASRAEAVTAARDAGLGLQK